MKLHPSKLLILILFTTLYLNGGGVSKPIETPRVELTLEQKLQALKDSVDAKEARLIEETLRKYELVRKNGKNPK